MRSVIVTGGSRGIGLGIARRLAAGGDRVIVIARTPSPGLEEAARAHPNLAFIPFDLAETAALRGLVKGLRRDFGPIHGLVNNAGASLSGVLANLPEAQIAQLLHLNVTAPILLTKYVARGMMSAGAGRIINIASITARKGHSGLSVYAASKAALVGFTHSLARELGPLGITVNAIAPGFIATDMTQSLDDAQRAKLIARAAMRRLASVDDIAAATLFLLGDEARNITGTVITVDAGNTA